MLRPQEGSFPPSVMCVGQRQRGQKDNFTSNIPLEPTTLKTLHMLQQHCVDYPWSLSYLMTWKHLKLTVFGD